MRDLSLLRDPEYLKFWTGQSVSLLGSQFTLLALPIAAAVTLHATAAEMGVLAALQFAPGLVVGLGAGVWLDRTRRRPVLVATQLVSAIVLATVPLTASAHVLGIAQLFAVAFLAGAAASFSGVAQVSFLPALVGRGRLVEANARYETSRTAAMLVGPGLAGVAIQVLTAPVAIALDAASFVVGAATAAWIRVTEPAVVRPPHRNVVSEAVAGFALVWRHPLLRAISGTLLVANAGGGMANAVVVLLFVGQIGVSPAELGLVYAVSSFSTLVGSLVIRPLQRRAGLGPAMALATTLLAVGVVVRTSAAFTPRPLTLPLLVASSLISGFGLMTYNIPQMSIQQAVIPSHLLGRTTAAVGFVVNAASVAAALAGGVLGQLAGLRWALVVATTLTMACGLPTVLSPLRRLRDVPDS